MTAPLHSGALPPPEISRIAARAFTARQAAARRSFAQGKAPLDAATAHLRPWLAIACRLGADLPELDGPLADCRLIDVEGEPILSEARLRWLAAEDICAQARWRPVLITARNRALDRADTGRPEDLEEALALIALCRALGLTDPYLPAPAKEKGAPAKTQSAPAKAKAPAPAPPPVRQSLTTQPAPAEPAPPRPPAAQLSLLETTP